MGSSMKEEKEINTYVQTLLAGEVPRLILKEYEQTRHTNQILTTQNTELTNLNAFLESENQKVSTELKSL